MSWKFDMGKRIKIHYKSNLQQGAFKKLDMNIHPVMRKIENKHEIG